MSTEIERLTDSLAYWITESEEAFGRDTREGAMIMVDHIIRKLKQLEGK